jgi:hypothetical protein
MNENQNPTICSGPIEYVTFYVTREALKDLLETFNNIHQSVTVQSYHESTNQFYISYEK